MVGTMSEGISDREKISRIAFKCLQFYCRKVMSDVPRLHALFAALSLL